MRKPTPSEREEIILNYIKANSGKAITVTFFANKLGVTKRIIQNILAKFKKQGLIKASMPNNKINDRKGNIIEYIGEDKTISHCTLENLYNAENPYGFRDFDWERYKVIVGYYTEDFTENDAKQQYGWLQADKKRLKDKREKLINNSN